MSDEKKEKPTYAHPDGFESADDMRAFWRTEHPDVEKFNGVLIKWEPT